MVGVSGNSVDSANSQFHAQNDFGQYNYGFSNPTQTKQEVKTADGITRGSYSYVDANNLIQSKIRIFTRRVNGNRTENLTRRNLHGIFTAADGIVRGAYQYLDSEGDIQTVNYIADNLGFKVAGTSLPIDAVDLPVPVIHSQNTEKYNPSLLIYI